jgi:hypothetical protein
MDAAFLNGVANHEAVRPMLAGKGEIDMAAALALPDNYGLVCEHGGFLLMPVAEGVYEVHSMFLPNGGSAPIRAMREAQEWMFTRTDCAVICSKVPAGNHAAKGFAIVGGLTPVFESEHPQVGQTEFVELSLMKWATGTKALEEHGARFHDAINSLGLDVPEHNDDPIHERAAGAALLMFERGQPVKATVFYNQWATWAGYPPIALLCSAPVTVDVGEGFIFGLGSQGMEILKCP